MVRVGTIPPPCHFGIITTTLPSPFAMSKALRLSGRVPSTAERVPRNSRSRTVGALTLRRVPSHASAAVVDEDRYRSQQSGTQPETHYEQVRFMIVFSLEKTAPTLPCSSTPLYARPENSLMILPASSYNETSPSAISITSAKAMLFLTIPLKLYESSQKTSSTSCGTILLNQRTNLAANSRGESR